MTKGKAKGTRKGLYISNEVLDRLKANIARYLPRKPATWYRRGVVRKSLSELVTELLTKEMDRADRAAKKANK